MSKLILNKKLSVDVAFIGIQLDDEVKNALIDAIIDYHTIIGEFPRKDTIIAVNGKKYLIAVITYISTDDYPALIRFLI